MPRAWRFESALCNATRPPRVPPCALSPPPVGGGGAWGPADGGALSSRSRATRASPGRRPQGRGRAPGASAGPLPWGLARGGRGNRGLGGAPGSLGPGPEGAPRSPLGPLGRWGHGRAPRGARPFPAPFPARILGGSIGGDVVMSPAAFEGSSPRGARALEVADARPLTVRGLPSGRSPPSIYPLHPLSLCWNQPSLSPPASPPSPSRVPVREFGALINSVARNPGLTKQLFGYAILGFALAESVALFALMMAFMILFVF